MASRTVVLAGVGAVVIAGAAYWFLYMQDDAPPPAKPMAAAPKADAAIKPAAAPGADAAKPPAAASPSPAGDDKLAAMDREIKATQTRVGELEKTMADLRNQIAVK